MTEELLKVKERIRGVVDGKLVVRRPGQFIERELAERLGIVEPAPPPGPPSAPAGARKAAAKPKPRAKPKKKGKTGTSARKA